MPQNRSQLTGKTQLAPSMAGGLQPTRPPPAPGAPSPARPAPSPSNAAAPQRHGWTSQQRAMEICWNQKKHKNWDVWKILMIFDICESVFTFLGCLKNLNRRIAIQEHHREQWWSIRKQWGCLLMNSSTVNREGINPVILSQPSV